MKLLIVGLNYAPEPVGIGPFTAGLAEGLVARGHEVRVITGKPYYPQWQLYDGHDGTVHTTIENGVGVTRVPHYIPAVPSGPRRIAHLASFARNARVPARIAASAGADLVLAIAPSLLSAPIAAHAARRAGAPLWLHFQDLEVDAALATEMLDRGPARAGRWLESAMLQRASMISTISPQMQARLDARIADDQHTMLLRNWSTVAIDANTDGAELRESWRLGGRKVALYSGNIANKQGLDIVIDCARALRHRDDLAFVICGEGPNRSELEWQAADLPNVHFHDLRPVEELPGLLALADIHLLPQIADAADLVLPSKLGNILVSGRPVVATAGAGTGVAEEVQDCGLLVPPGDADAFAVAISRLADDEELRSTLSAHGRRRAASHWSQSIALDRFEEAATALIEQSAR